MGHQREAMKIQAIANELDKYITNTRLLAVQLRAVASALQQSVNIDEPIAWITDESLQRLSSGGNQSRGSVPCHAKESQVAKHPLYK